MGALGIVKCHPILDDASGLEAVSDFFEIDRFLLQVPPETLDEDVIEMSAPSIHRDTHPSVGQGRDPSRSGELAALIRIHDLGWAVFGDSLVQSVHTEVQRYCTMFIPFEVVGDVALQIAQPLAAPGA